MAEFKGTLKEFYEFVGPMTRNLICNMARGHKKHTSCSHNGCNKRKPLEAAHIKGKERPQIISDILSDFQLDKDLFLVDLEIFKKKFIKAHTPIHEVILPMCKAHHLEYDKKENIQQEYPIVLDEFETETGEDVYTVKELDTIEENELLKIKEGLKTSLLNNLKSEVCKKYNLENSQVAFSRISESNNLWNFDVSKKKFNRDFAFIFYNQNNQKYNVTLIKANVISANDFAEKDENTIRFFVDKNYKDRSGFDFKEFFK